MKNELLVIRDLEFIIRDRRSRLEFGAWGGFFYWGVGEALLITHYSLFIALSLCLKKGLPLPSDLAIFCLADLTRCDGVELHHIPKNWKKGRERTHA
jgi:hypothetical protein